MTELGERVAVLETKVQFLQDAAASHEAREQFIVTTVIATLGIVAGVLTTVLVFIH